MYFSKSPAKIVRFLSPTLLALSFNSNLPTSSRANYAAIINPMKHLKKTPCAVKSKQLDAKNNANNTLIFFVNHQRTKYIFEIPEPRKVKIKNKDSSSRPNYATSSRPNYAFHSKSFSLFPLWVQHASSNVQFLVTHLELKWTSDHQVAFGQQLERLDIPEKPIWKQKISKIPNMNLNQCNF